MPKSLYPSSALRMYIHTAQGQTSLAELCDRDGNVLAEILPKGSPVHREIVIDLLRTMIKGLETVEAAELTPEQVRAMHSASDWERRYGSK